MANIKAELDRIGTLLRSGRADEAEHASRRLLAKAPQDVNAVSLMGFTLLRAGKPAQAEYFVRRTLAALPDTPRSHVNLAKTLWLQAKTDEAARVLESASATFPADPEVGECLGELLLTRQQPAAALGVATAVLSARPDHPGALAVWAKAQQRLGNIEQALAALARAAAVRPGRVDLIESLAFMEQYNPAVTARSIFEAHHRWGKALCAIVPMLPQRPLSAPGAPLRVGVISPDFRRHAVASFTMAFVRHCPADIDLTCYSVVDVEDEVTAQFRSGRAAWRSVASLDDDALAARIAADRIDVLIDLAGHTNNDRLRLFAMRPAPVQVTYVGYAGTTGHPRIDARIVDEVSDPPGSEADNAETLIRIATPHHCYAPYEPPPPVASAPCLANGHVTFGCFGGVIKMNRPLLSLWSRLLAALPSARLLIKHGASTEPEAVETLRGRCVSAGIPADRLTIITAAATHTEHLRAYAHADIALDTYPFTGATTTCEALLMGLPVLTRPGPTHASRMAASMLTGLGHPEWIECTEDRYIARAVSLASDIPALARLREGLRAKLLASPLCDAPAHAKHFAAALREAVELVRRRTR
ncbi:MAG: O-linked N-acetylglucosamine transferase, SPINDLY family protein [Phycisphaerales bacterium]